MEGVDLVIKGVDVRPSFYRACPRTRPVSTVPLSTSITRAVETHAHRHTCVQAKVHSRRNTRAWNE